jgi:hypothetical protein
MDQQSQQHVQLQLSADEALVLFAFSSRFTESDQLTVADRSEAQVLWNLCGRLEKQLAEPFSPRYAEMLAQARARVRGDDPEPAAS